MSDLKHMTAEQLREEVKSLSRSRSKLELAWKLDEEFIVKMQADIVAKRQKHHNLGQREAWARIYLAQKS